MLRSGAQRTYLETSIVIQLYDNATGDALGSVTDEQLQFLIDQLEEESSDDRDYYFNPATLDLLETRGADPDLVALLRKAIGDKEGVEIRWSRQ